MTETVGYYALQRFSLWRCLGFGECRALRPEEDELTEGWAPSWFAVGTKAHLDWRDRLRVLISGNLHIDHAIKTDAIINKSRATSAISVLPPGRIRP
jgi:hypothetical protein